MHSAAKRRPEPVEGHPEPPDREPTRVALFSDYYPPHLGGGVESVVDELSWRLVAAGADVDVFTLHTAGGPAFETRDGVRVHRSPALELTRLAGLQTAVSPRLFADALGALRADPPDVIHAHNPFFFSSLVAAACARLLGRPLVTTLHLGGLEALAWRQRLPSLAYERSLGRGVVAASDRVIAVSGAVAAYAERYGARPAKTVVQPNAVDTQRFRPDDGERDRPPRFACVGRLIENKGPQYLVEALPALLTAAPDAEVWFIGDGPLRGALAARVSALSVEARVRFLGTRDDVDALLRQCDVCVRPSLTEGLPLTVLEAMATALPVVATPVGGTPEAVLDGETGLLVPPRDIGALGAALRRLALDPALRRRLGANGRKRVETGFSWQRNVEQTLRIYEEVIGARQRRRAPMAGPPRRFAA